jgi:hypothetical protein
MPRRSGLSSAEFNPKSVRCLCDAPLGGGAAVKSAGLRSADDRLEYRVPGLKTPSAASLKVDVGHTVIDSGFHSLRLASSSPYHEFGHFWVSGRLGFKVLRFS